MGCLGAPADGPAIGESKNAAKSSSKEMELVFGSIDEAGGGDNLCKPLLSDLFFWARGMSSSSASSKALGALSDKKSRSSEESAAIESRGLVFGRENLVKNLDTADGAGSGVKKSNGSDCGSVFIEAIDAGKGAAIGVGGISAEGTGRRPSALCLGDCETGLLTGIGIGGRGGGDGET